ncbi:EF-hand domain-containing protein [Dyella silvatica]|uniref:EF-hand domain-containing protein n=1 Tax=Dyella silvatica TaxID=2992128 RepID=UPI002255C03F|nr:EF-hand domain-containing protein [Dyella silvatica]
MAGIADLAARGMALWLLVPLGVAAQSLPSSPAEYLQRMDTNGDGKVSEAEYVAYMSHGFRQMDTNGDGILEASELPGGHGKPVTLQSYQDNLRRQFHKLDRNHHGYLNARELTAPPQP